MTQSNNEDNSIEAVSDFLSELAERCPQIAPTLNYWAGKDQSQEVDAATDDKENNK